MLTKNETGGEEALISATNPPVFMHHNLLRQMAKPNKNEGSEKTGQKR